MWLRASPDDVDDRERNGDGQRLENAEDDHTDGRRSRDSELEPADEPQPTPGRSIHEPDRGRDDHGAEHGHRQVRHRLREKEEHEGDRAGCHEPRDLRSRAHLIVHGRARAARAQGEALRDARRRAHPREREELLVRTHLLVVLPGEGPGGEDPVGEADEEDPDRRRHEVGDVAQGRRGDRDAREARGDRADDGDTVAREVDGPRHADRDDDDDEGRRDHG